MKLEILRGSNNTATVEWSFGTQSGMASGTYSMTQESHGPVASFELSETRGDELPGEVRSAIELELESQVQ